MNTLETHIDALYALPLDRFTAARNALAKGLRGEELARVKRLAKPSTVPWAVNQLYWRRRELYEPLMAAGRALHAAQVAALEGKPADLRAAMTAHRAALTGAAAAATALAGEAGVSPGADPLTRMLEAISLAPAPPAEPGRFTDFVQPAGFEALAGITPAPSRQGVPPLVTASPDAATARPSKGSAAAERRRLEAEAEAARAAADAAVEDARRQLSAAETAEARVAAQVNLARLQLQRTEVSLTQAQALVKAAEALVAHAETARRRL